MNIHHSTVSRALRNDSRINSETRDRVLLYASEHAYQINMNAVQLRGTQNNAIALIVPNINHSFFSDITSQLTDIAFAKGYVISVFQTNESTLREQEIIQTIIKHNFAGVIASIAKDTARSDHFALLSRFSIPLVFFDRVCSDIPVPKVVVDNGGITEEAVSYLARTGYSRIAHLTGTPQINVFRDRQNGYLKGLKDQALEYSKPVVIEEEFSTQIGQDLFRQWWEASDTPDAVISSSMLLTIGVITEAHALGIPVSSFPFIITFGSTIASGIISPPIHTIEQPESEIAEQAFDLLEKVMNHEIDANKERIHTLNAKILIAPKQ